MTPFRKILTSALGAFLALAGAAPVDAAQQEEWPAGKSPREIGKRVAERFVGMPHLRDNTIIYPETCAWYGSLTFAQLSGDKDLSKRLVARFDKLLTPEESK